MSLRVEMTFDSDKLAEYGYTKEDVVYSIKEAYAKYGIRCESEVPVHAFVGGERDTDFGYMWVVIMALCRSQWFMDCATSCMWYRTGYSEDVLKEARKRRAEGRLMK